MTTNTELEVASCDINEENTKAKRNKKQVCFSDEELSKYAEFLKSKGKFSLYVKRLIEQDFNGSNHETEVKVDLSSLEREMRDLKALMLDEFKKINNTQGTSSSEQVEDTNAEDKKREQEAMNAFLTFAK